MDHFIDSIEDITEDMKTGGKIKLSRNEVFRKTGVLYSLRHQVNLSSGLLDVPDFYWDRQDLENFYRATCAYLSLRARTNTFNEKITHCTHLMDLISSHLNDKHHVRLEWMIIILIMVEVAFECIHYYHNYIVGHSPPSDNELLNEAHQ